MNKTIKYLLIIPIILSLSAFPKQKNETFTTKTDPPFIGYSSQWVDSVFATMSLDEKIGQLFMCEVYPNQQDQSKTTNLIKKYHIGGIIYFKGHPTKIAQLTNQFQQQSLVPLMVAIDGEWGVGMRLDSVVVFPHQMMLGAIDDNKLIYEMGKSIANQCHNLGINVNFAPVIDINNNPANPVIGVRSFGEDKISVAQKGYAYMLGMQDSHILAVAKHFPGHGDTDVDSHRDLPVITASKQRLDTLELFPFKQLINAGVGGVMVAHLYVPELDNTKNLPSTLSKKIVKKLLIKELDFKGLIFTDALGMQGVAKYYGAGEAEIKALQAGNDILLMSQDVPTAFNAIKQAVLKGKISEKIIDEKVKKILLAKYWMHLNKFKKIDTKNLFERLNSEQDNLLNRELVENALTLVKNTNNLIPFSTLKNVKFAAVSIGNGQTTIFQDFLLRYANIDIFTIDKNASSAEFANLTKQLSDYDYVIVGIHDTRQYAVKTYGITMQTINFVDNLANKNAVVLDLFGNPYALRRFNNLEKIRAVLVSYEDTDISQELSAQILFGGISAKGHLPVGVENFSAGTGIITSQIRLKYSIPEELHLNDKYLQLIDSVIYSAIGNKAFPGCQILAIKDGIVFFQKNYGYQTYKMQKHVKWNDVYDVASVTKITATLPALMKLYDENKFSVDAYMRDYLPELDTTNKRYLKVIDVLTHQARLKPWIPFYHKALNTDGSWKKEYLSNKYSDKYCIQVAKNVYTTKEFDSLVYQRIYASDLLRRKRYKYSDLGFYLFKKIIEKITNQTLDKYVAENFYENLGAYTLGYNPLLHGIKKEQIAPTEYDYKFRKQLIQGFVHDYGAAVLGGVGGHAGIFSSANDLAKLLQMYLQDGVYGGIRYFNKNTVKYFATKPFYNSRRALGFDSTNGNGEGPACSLASYQSFGHTGFTGCMVWVDPKYNFIYIFLSNRIYPSVENKRIVELNVREQVQSLFYQSFLYYSK